MISVTFRSRWAGKFLTPRWRPRPSLYRPLRGRLITVKYHDVRILAAVVLAWAFAIRMVDQGPAFYILLK